MSFNFFINDIFYNKLNSQRFNYADDTGGCYAHKDISIIKIS